MTARRARWLRGRPRVEAEVDGLRWVGMGGGYATPRSVIKDSTQPNAGVEETLNRYGTYRI
jgi:hypothetical protein